MYFSKGTQGSLFVSYSHRDRDLVLTLLGIVPDVWHASFIDFLHTPRGSDWANHHNHRIEESDRVLLCWSINAAKSKHVEREWKYAKNVGSPIIPILLDNTPLPSELVSIHAIALDELIHAEGIVRGIQPIFIKHSRYAKMIGALIVAFATCSTFASVLFLFPPSGTASTILLGLVLLFALGCFVASILLFQFAYRWNKVKDRLTAEVIHGLKTEVRTLSAQGTQPLSSYPLHERRSKPVVIRMDGKENLKLPAEVEGLIKAALDKVEDELQKARALASAEFNRQRQQRLREEADRRGVLKAARFRSGAVKCPNCPVSFSIPVERPLEVPRCPSCHTLVEPTEDYEVIEHLGHKFLGDICAECGSTRLFVDNFKPSCLDA